LFLQACPAAEAPTNLVVFGSGAQAHSHALVFLNLFPSIKKVTFAVRSRNDRATSLVRALQKARSGVDFTLAVTLNSDGTKADLSEIVRAANIIVTVTSSTEALFRSSAVSPGTRLVLVGSYTPKMREVDDDLIKRAGIIVVDSKEACGHEAGELISAGIKDDELIELGTLVGDPETAKSAGKGGDVVIFKSVSIDIGGSATESFSADDQVGLGIQDVAIAKLVFDEAEKKSIGSRVVGYDTPSEA
jgi:ornithine cyclodeaminase/alanine dehydrogenase-like protein (mu-crystallin family)